EATGHRQPTRQTPLELMVCETLSVRVTEVPGGVARPEHRRGVDQIDNSPVAGDQTVTRNAEVELVVSEGRLVPVREVHETGRLTVETDSVDSIAVEVTCERLVTGI